MARMNFLNYLPGSIFCIIIMIILLKGNEPWRYKERKRQREEWEKKIEWIKDEGTHDFFSNCEIKYTKGFPQGSKIDLDELADIITDADRNYEMVNRETLFGEIVFLNKMSEYDMSLRIYSYKRKAFVVMYIYSGSIVAGSHKYTSKKLVYWTEKNFPKIFEKIREYNNNMEK